MTIIVTVVVIVVITLVFAIARSQFFAAEAERKKEEVEQQRLELLEENARIEQRNKRIQDQLMLTQLNAKQVAIVEANSLNLNEEVPAGFQLTWRALKFEDRLGSGSFGDCYKGRCVNRPLCDAIRCNRPSSRPPGRVTKSNSSHTVC